MHLLHRLSCPWSSNDQAPPAAYRGEYAELVAASYLRAQGVRVLRHRFRWGRRGELDIVARQGDELVLCEVKSTISPESGAPARAITLHKRRLLRLGAHDWLRLLRRQIPIRFDVLEVYLRPAARPHVVWHKAAFPFKGK